MTLEHRLTTRTGFGVLGLAALAAAFATFGVLAALLWLVPDLTMLAGISRDMPRDGRMPTRAIPFYNAAHRLLPPALLAVTGLIVATPFVLGLGLTWLSHVLIDRALGYGLRDHDGWQRV